MTPIGQVGPRLLSWGASIGTPSVQVPAAQIPVAQPAPWGVDQYVPSALPQLAPQQWPMPLPQQALDPRVQAQLSQLTQQLMALQAELNTLIQNPPAAPVAPPAMPPAPPAPPAPPPPPPPAPPAPPAPPPPAPPAPPPPPAPAPAPAPAPEQAKTYTVESGDTLSAIAQKTLGDGNRWHEIFDLNQDQISDPDVIQPGQVLKLPGGADAAPAPAPDNHPGNNNIVDAARALKADGYHYTVNLTSNYHPQRFKVGCCADFAIDSWAKAGKDLYHEISNPHYVPTIMKWMKDHGEYAHTAKPGDMVFFDWDGDGEGDHVAIVTEVDGNGHATKIIESYDFNLPVRERGIGNSSDNIMGYAHP